MENNKGFRRIPLGVLIAIGMVVVASGGSAAWFTWRTLNPQPPVAEFPTLEGEIDEAAKPPLETLPSENLPADPPVKEPDSSQAAEEVTLALYWLKDTGSGMNLVPESITLSQPGSEAERLKAAFQQLLSKSGDPEQNAFSTIPPETQLIDLSVETDGVHVNLSEDFRFGGGSAAMIGRLGQIIYTASALDADAPVWISVEGKPLTLLGGEGLIVDQPMTRSDFQNAFDL